MVGGLGFAPCRADRLWQGRAGGIDHHPAVVEQSDTASRMSASDRIERLRPSVSCGGDTGFVRRGLKHFQTCFGQSGVWGFAGMDHRCCA
jgi:hypothetical protein